MRYETILPNGAIATLTMFKDPTGLPITHYIEDLPSKSSTVYTSFYLLPNLKAKYLCITNELGVTECMEYGCPNEVPVFYKKFSPIAYNGKGEGFMLPSREAFGVLDDIETGIKQYVVSPVTSAFDTVEDTVKSAVQTVAKPLKSAANEVISGINSAKDKVVDFTTKTIPNTATQIAGKVSGFAEDAYKTVKGEVTGLIGKIGDLDIPGKFMSVVDKVKDVGQTVGTTVYNSMDKGFTFVKDGAVNAFDTVKDGVLTAKDYIVKYGSLVGTNIADVAKKIGTGFYDISKTIKDQGEKIANKIVGAAGPVINTSKDVVVGVARVIEWIGEKLYKFFDFLSSKRGLFLFKGFFVLLVLLVPLFLFKTYKTVKMGITGKSSVTADLMKKFETAVSQVARFY